MERSLPAPTMRLFVGKTGIFMPTFVEEVVRTIRQIAPRKCRDGFKHLPYFELACPECFFHLFALSDVKRGHIPPIDSSLLIEQRIVADQEPPISAVLTQRALLVFELKRAFEGLIAHFAQPFRIFRVVKSR